MKIRPHIPKIEFSLSFFNMSIPWFEAPIPSEMIPFYEDAIIEFNPHKLLFEFEGNKICFNLDQRCFESYIYNSPNGFIEYNSEIPENAISLYDLTFFDDINSNPEKRLVTFRFVLNPQNPPFTRRMLMAVGSFQRKLSNDFRVYPIP